MGNGRIGVIGLGKTGRALLSYLLNHTGYEEIVVFDDKVKDLSDLSEGETGKRAVLVTGNEGLSRLAATDRVIISPGVNGREKRFDIIRDTGIPLISELEFAFSMIRGRIIAVTGTNGKSTTVSLIHHLLTASGRRSYLTGNIGVPLISEAGHIGPDDFAALEVSSFQLEEIEGFRPWVTLILNLTPDHLDRYPSFRDYAEAKLNILKNLDENDPVILNNDDPFLRKEFRGPGGRKFRKIWFSLYNNDFSEGAWTDGGDAVIRLNGNEKRLSLAGNPLIGSHNIENILASLLAVSIAGAGAAAIERSLGDFRGLPHRMEVCGEKNGVRFINDSKATNVDATVKSITGIDESIALILGGKDKGGDFSVIESFIGKKVKKIILIGEAADAISAVLRKSSKWITRAKTLDEALRKGFEALAGSGGSVLLAPGCASFDMFLNYEDRGDVFKKSTERFLREK